MRALPPRLGSTFSLLGLLIAIDGCARAGVTAEARMVAPGLPPGPPSGATEPALAEAAAPQAAMSRAPMPEAAPAGVPAGATLATANTAGANAAGAGNGAPAASREMLDIEGNVNLEVARVSDALGRLRELTARAGGTVTAERVDTAAATGSAELTVRVPSAAATGVFEELQKLGKVLQQTVTARDIGKEYFDANLRLSSLEATFHRYEEILARATKVDEILRIEQELARVRSEIEQVKGNLRWLSDRAARATLHLHVHERAPAPLIVSEEPQPKFFPGLRLPALVDFGVNSTETYVGGGVSLGFSRGLSLDLDVLKRPGSGARGPDALLATLGGEFYSELLGGGDRRFLNPYLGWRAGYARFDRDNQALLGATLGLELFDNRRFGVDLEVRNYLAFIGDRGLHFLVTPAITLRFAF